MNETDEDLEVLTTSEGVGWTWQLESAGEYLQRREGLSWVKYVVYLCHKSWITHEIYQARPLLEFFGKTPQEAIQSAARYLVAEIGDW